jgi:hypothetical protein
MEIVMAVGLGVVGGIGVMLWSQLMLQIKLHHSSKSGS